MSKITEIAILPGGLFIDGVRLNRKIKQVIYDATVSLKEIKVVCYLEDDKGHAILTDKDEFLTETLVYNR